MVTLTYNPTGYIRSLMYRCFLQSPSTASAFLPGTQHKDGLAPNRLALISDIYKAAKLGTMSLPSRS